MVSDRDGFGRLFANGTRLLLTTVRRAVHEGPKNGNSHPRRWKRESFLMKVFLIGLVTILPIGLYLLLGEPVTLLQLAGAIEAAHIPVLVGLTLYLNRRELPASLGPSRAVFGATLLAALFFLAFAGVYLYQLATGQA